MAVPFLPQNQLVYPANADLSQGIASLGETVANSIQQGRNRNALIKVSERIGSGDYQGAVAEAVKSGDPKVVQSVNSLIGAQGVHGTPIYGIDPATGQPVVGTLTKMGGFRRADTGGIIPQLPGGQYYDVGTGRVFANPRFPGVSLPPTTVPQSGGAPVQSGAQMQPGAQPRPQAMPSRGSMAPSYIPKDVAGEEREKKIGAGQGAAQVSLESIRSKLPGLRYVFNQLNDLAEKSTYTMVGQMYDIGRRQLNLPPREAAVARARYISMVDNQILPLLRDTFGAQFTEREGNTLRATLGNPDLSPAEKKAVLDSFIEQKIRDVEALQLQTGKSSAPVRVNTPDEARRLPSGTSIILPDGSMGRVP